MNEDAFKLTQGFASYVSKPEITEIGPNFLVYGSKNVLIDYAKRVISRNGYTLLGAASNGGGPIRMSYDWDTSTNRQFIVRTHDGKLEFWWNNAWNLLRSGFPTSTMQFAKIWDLTELLDMLVFVLADQNTWKWSGGATKVRSSGSTSVTKQGVLTSVTTIAFNAGTYPTVAPTITDSSGSFLSAGFAAGDTLYVSGSISNSRNFKVGTVTAGTITLIMSDTLVSEAAGPTVTVHNGEPTWASSRFLSNNTLSTRGTSTVTVASPAVVTSAGHALLAGDIIQFTTTGALPTGLLASTDYYVLQSGLTSSTFQLSATLGGTAIPTTGTQSGVHTLFKKIVRAIIYNGVTYPYASGETTDTLQGLLSFPSVTAGDAVWQAPVSLPNPPAISASFRADLIGVQLNQLILASTVSQEVYGSLNTDYTNFTLTSPRAPGDPFKVNMDNYATCIVPIDNKQQTTSSLAFGAGTSEFFQLSYQLSQDNANELVRMIKLKTAAGSGLIAKGAICPIKDNTAYISREPALDTIDRVQNADRQDVPISDPVKADFDLYGTDGFARSHVIYWKRAIYIALPALGLVLIYDLMRNLWQPPQTMPVARFSIIGDWLHGHSSIGNETYRLFTGTSDNGNVIPQVARFAYNNGGARGRLKNMSQYWSDGYISASGVLNMTQNLGFAGNVAIRNMQIIGSDQAVTVQQGGSMLGDEPLGATPIGGATIDAPASIQNGTMLRFYQEDSMDLNDYFESYVEYSMESLDGQFAIVAHGSNQWDAGTSPVSHKK